jgi:hypothetical protein
MASKRRLRRQSCEGKVRHETAGAAWIAAKRTGDGRETKPYRCPFCGLWHVGHLPHRKTTRSDFRFAGARM